MQLGAKLKEMLDSNEDLNVVSHLERTCSTTIPFGQTTIEQTFFQIEFFPHKMFV